MSINIKNEILYEISNKLFELFVVNRRAIAVQQPNGDYKTKYINVTTDDIFCMLNEGKAIGTYQQLYKSYYLKWICFDFDCKDKEHPDIFQLYNCCTKPLNDFLWLKGIHFVNEFSGRRGIHTWILFDKFIAKQDAYNLIQEIKKGVAWNYSDKDYGLDEFPSTPNSKGNVVGKQVKIPLSKHMIGHYSYFFKGEFEKTEDYNESFFINQLNLLNSIKANSFEDVAKKMSIINYDVNSSFKLIKINDDIELSSEEVIQILSETEVFKKIINRILNGDAKLIDWQVMLGTLGRIGSDYKLLKDIFKYSPSFSEEKTNNNIKFFGKRFYPATFEYLYNLYNIKIEPSLDPNMTGLEFLATKLGINTEISDFNENELSILNNSLFTVNKEINYLKSNDEVPFVSVWDDLNHMTKYDTERINTIIEKIKCGEVLSIEPEEFYIFERYENKDKIRKMVTLSAYDRVLTSHIALNIFYGLKCPYKTYSYNLNYISTEEMFYPWFSSWRNYIERIRKFIDIGLYFNLNVITIDIKQFYDSIDFMGVYNLLQSELAAERSNLFLTLINYNEKLMRKINSTRIGVPQGPAYARIIAEYFLELLIKNILSEIDNSGELIHLYRYVDDIVIFHDKTIDSKYIFNIFEINFKNHGLEINKNKSKIYGEVGKLSDDEKAELLRNKQFQYGLNISNYLFLPENKYVNKRIKSKIESIDKFNVNDIRFYFSNYTDERAKKIYFNKFVKDIIKCTEGRGSGYQLFYKFIFKKNEILKTCLDKDYFLLVPYNSINQSCLLSIMFYSFCDDTISSDLKIEIINKFVSKIELKKIIGEEDKSIILSLLNNSYEYI